MSITSCTVVFCCMALGWAAALFDAQLLGAQTASPHHSSSAPARVKRVPVVGIERKGGDLRTQFQREIDSATAHGQFVLVDVGASWCGPCQQFEQTFSDSLMIAALAPARVVHVDFDTWRWELSTGGYVDAWNLPELFVLTADGGKGASFEHAQWEAYADSLSVSGVKSARDAELLAPPLRTFLAAIQQTRMSASSGKK